MFLHLYKYRIKTLVRERTLVFWTILFPIILATFFKIAIGGIGQATAFNMIPVAVVEDVATPAEEALIKTIKSLSQGENALFEAKFTDREGALKLINEKAVSGAIIPGEPNELIVFKSGINQSILKNFLEQYEQSSKLIESVYLTHPENVEAVIASLNDDKALINSVPLTDKDISGMQIYFYGLIAMSCLYGSLYGLEEVNRIQANLSPTAARMNMPPVHKMKLFMASTYASMTVHFAGLMILLFYIIYILGVPFGDSIGYIILVILFGSMLGVAFGAFISSIFKKSEGIKIGIALLVSMTGAFLAGMMVADMKYIVAQSAPIVAKLNPANILSDALYSIYYYDSMTQYWSSLLSIVLYTVVFSVATYFVIRRRKYASL